MKRTLLKVAGLLPVLFLITTPLLAQVSLVKDINAEPAGFTETNNYSQIFCNCGSNLFFLKTTDKGRELWRTDGTKAGTFLVKDIYKGYDYGVDGPLFCNGNGAVYFTGNDATNGRELWISDGTENGTRLVKDITPGVDGFSNILGIFGSDVYLLADYDSDDKMEIWKSNGSAGGTTLVTTLSFTGQSFPFTTVFSDTHIFFNLNSQNQNKLELWAFNVAANTTDKLLEDAWITDPTKFGDKILFAAIDQTHYTQSLWLSDGTPGGTTKFKDFGAANIQTLIKYGDKVVFGSAGKTWITDGTDAGTTMVASGYVNASAVVDGDFYGVGFDYATNTNRLLKIDGSTMQATTVNGNLGDILTLAQIQVLDNKLVFPYYDPALGSELGISDDTRTHITLVKDINPGTASSAPRSWTTFEGRIYFLANDLAHGSQIWSTDGTEQGTTRLTDPLSTSDALQPYDPGLAVSDNQLYFLAAASNSPAGGAGWDIYTSDGTEAGTTMQFDLESGSGFLVGKTDKSVIYCNGWKLYKTNGPTEPVTFFSDFNGNRFGFGTNRTSHYTLGDKAIFAFFSVGSPLNLGSEFWVSDGTETGTHVLKDINPGVADGASGMGIVVGSKFIFEGIDNNGSELWISDGTTAGTQLLKDISTGSSDSKPAYFAALNDKVIFAATTTDNGREVWITDGTEQGTHLAVDMISGPTSSDPKDFAKAGNVVFFTADGGSGRRALWKTDGTPAGTVLVKDMLPENDKLHSPTNLTGIGSKLFFAADDGTHGNELWVSDGTTEGTFVIDIINGPQSSDPSMFLAIENGVVYFKANGELWRTNGTTATTSKVSDITPLNMIPMKNTLFLTAAHPEYGIELFKAEFTKFDQQITITPVSNKTLGDAAFKIEASASSALPMVITSESELTMQNNTATIVKAGTVKVTAQQAGDDFFNPAESSLTFCILPAKPVISMTGAETGEPVLTSHASAGNQWYKETLAISNETSQTFKPSENGAYKLTVTVDGCTSIFSDDATVIIMGVESFNDGISLFPNPVRETLRIETGDIDNVSITITDVSGSALCSYDLGGNETINYSLAGYPAGVYIVRLETKSGVSYKKIIKQQ